MGPNMHNQNRVMTRRRMGISTAATLIGAMTTGALAQTAKTPARPRLAPDFALRDADGKEVRLSKLRGKVVLINFWATWCLPCKIEIPWFGSLRKKFGDSGLEVIGVSLDEKG